MAQQDNTAQGNPQQETQAPSIESIADQPAANEPTDLTPEDVAWFNLNENAADGVGKLYENKLAEVAKDKANEAVEFSDEDMEKWFEQAADKEVMQRLRKEAENRGEEIVKAKRNFSARIDDVLNKYQSAHAKEKAEMYGQWEEEADKYLLENREKLEKVFDELKEADIGDPEQWADKRKPVGENVIRMPKRESVEKTVPQIPKRPEEGFVAPENATPMEALIARLDFMSDKLKRTTDYDDREEMMKAMKRVRDQIKTLEREEATKQNIEGRLEKTKARVEAEEGETDKEAIAKAEKELAQLEARLARSTKPKTIERNKKLIEAKKLEIDALKGEETSDEKLLARLEADKAKLEADIEAGTSVGAEVAARETARQAKEAADREAVDAEYKAAQEKYRKDLEKRAMERNIDEKSKVSHERLVGALNEININLRDLNSLPPAERYLKQEQMLKDEIAKTKSEDVKDELMTTLKTVRNKAKTVERSIATIKADHGKYLAQMDTARKWMTSGDTFNQAMGTKMMAELNADPKLFERASEYGELTGGNISADVSAAAPSPADLDRWRKKYAPENAPEPKVEVAASTTTPESAPDVAETKEAISVSESVSKLLKKLEDVDRQDLSNKVQKVYENVHTSPGQYTKPDGSMDSSKISKELFDQGFTIDPVGYDGAKKEVVAAIAGDVELQPEDSREETKAMSIPELVKTYDDLIEKLDAGEVEEDYVIGATRTLEDRLLGDMDTLYSELSKARSVGDKETMERLRGWRNTVIHEGFEALNDDEINSKIEIIDEDIARAEKQLQEMQRGNAPIEEVQNLEGDLEDYNAEKNIAGQVLEERNAPQEEEEDFVKDSTEPEQTAPDVAAETNFEDMSVEELDKLYTELRRESRKVSKEIKKLPKGSNLDKEDELKLQLEDVNSRIEAVRKARKDKKAA